MQCANFKDFYSVSSKSLPKDGLCFCRRGRLLLSSRFTGRGAPIVARAIVFTALVAVNFFGFFLRGIRLI